MPENKLPPQKKVFDVRVEVLVPTILTYKISALNEIDVLKELDKPTTKPVSMQPNHNRRIKLKATVYQQGTNMIKLAKIYRNIT